MFAKNVHTYSSSVGGEAEWHDKLLYRVLVREKCSKNCPLSFHSKPNLALHLDFACGLFWQKKLLIATVDIHLKSLDCDFLLLCIFAGVPSKKCAAGARSRSRCGCRASELTAIHLDAHQARRLDVHFGEKAARERVRAERATICLCCVSCHLCVRAHHRSWEACSHTSTVTMLSVGHPTLTHRHLQITAVTLFPSLGHLWLGFSSAYSHTAESSTAVPASKNPCVFTLQHLHPLIK